MRKLFTLLALVALASMVSAQTSPKSASKAAAKKECKKGDKCCSKASKENTASVGTKTNSAKKN